MIANTISLTQSSNSNSQSIFDYGELDTKYAGEDYNFIKAKRIDNWNKVKAALDANSVVYITDRLEVYVAPGDHYPIGSSVKSISGINKLTSQLVCYPFVKTGDSWVFEFDYGSTTRLSNITIKSAERTNGIESYQTILKFGGDTKKVKVLGFIRPDFWTDLTIGDTIIYSWSLNLILGKTAVVASFDESAQTITFVSDIDASVSSDTQGDNVWLGRVFNEEIPVEDYLAYTQDWVYEVNTPRCFYCQPAANSGTAFNFNIVNSDIQNFHQNLSISAGNGFVNITGDCATKDAFSTGMSFFGRNTNGDKRIQGDTLRIVRSGISPVGSISFLTGNLGAGIYAHPNIEIQLNELYLTDNLAASCRQYSSSHSVLNIRTGGYTAINRVICTGSGEYDMLLSYLQPTTIGYLESTKYIWGSNDLTISGGFMNQFTFGSSIPLNTKTHTVLFTNMTINGSWNGVGGTDSLGNPLDTIEIFYDNCEFVLPNDLSITWMMNPSSVINKLSVINSIIRAGLNTPYVLGVDLYEPPSSRSSAFIALLRIKNIIIDSVTTEQFFGEFMTAFKDMIRYPNRNYSISLNNSDIRMSIFSLTSNVITSSNLGKSNIYNGINNRIITSNQGLGYNIPQKITGKSGTTSVSVISSRTFDYAPQSATLGQTFSVNNVLEIDWDHDVYNVSGPATINHIASILYYQQWRGSCSNKRAGVITINAVGGDITINTRDESTNKYGNIKSALVIPSGTSKSFSVDSDDVLSNAANSVATVVTNTADGVLKAWDGYLPEALIVKTPITVTIGSIVGVSDSNGIITGTGIVDGFIDYGSGHLYIELASVPANGTDISVQYTKYNSWRASGTWTAI